MKETDMDNNNISGKHENGNMNNQIGENVKKEEMNKTDRTIELKYPKLYNFLLLYNFRNFYVNEDDNQEVYDTKTIRIYFNEENQKDDWFEFGIYDFGSDTKKKKDITKVISTSLLNMHVYSIRVDNDSSVLNVYLAPREYVERI